MLSPPRLPFRLLFFSRSLGAISIVDLLSAFLQIFFPAVFSHELLRFRHRLEAAISEALCCLIFRVGYNAWILPLFFVSFSLRERAQSCGDLAALGKLSLSYEALAPVRLSLSFPWAFSPFSIRLSSQLPSTLSSGTATARHSDLIVFALVRSSRQLSAYQPPPILFFLVRKEAALLPVVAPPPYNFEVTLPLHFVFTIRAQIPHFFADIKGPSNPPIPPRQRELPWRGTLVSFFHVSAGIEGVSPFLTDR